MTRQRKSHHFAVAGIAAAVATAFAMVLIGFGRGLPSISSKYDVRVVLPTAGSLTKGARVTMAGAKVGFVEGVARAGMGAVATLRITDDAVTPLPSDSRAALRMRTPVGENYVSITRGDARVPVSSGGLLSRPDEGYVDVDQLLSTLQGPIRHRVRALLHGTSSSLGGRGAQLNELLAGTSGVLVNGSKLTGVLYGDRVVVARLVDQLGDLADHLAERGQAIRGLARYGHQAMRAVASRRAAVRDLLDVLPSTLRSVRRTTGTLASVSDHATPVVANLATAIDEVRPAVERLRATSDEGRRLFRELGTTAPRLRPTLHNLARLSPPASTHLPKVTKALCALNPMLRYAQPYTPDVIATITGLGSASNAYDAIGHTIRLTPVVNERALAGGPDSALNAAHKLMHSGLLGRLNSLTWDPYPAPRMAGRSSAKGTPSVQNPEQLARSGYVFPRLHADC